MTVSCGVNFTLAVGENGGLWAWGNDINRNLDRGPTVPDDTLLQLQIHTPERVFKNRTQGVALRGVVAVSAVYRHSACVTETGELWMWGDGHWGQIGQGAPQSQNNSKCIARRRGRCDGVVCRYAHARADRGRARVELRGKQARRPQEQHPARGADQRGSPQAHRDGCARGRRREHLAGRPALRHGGLGRQAQRGAGPGRLGVVLRAA